MKSICGAHTATMHKLSTPPGPITHLVCLGTAAGRFFCQTPVSRASIIHKNVVLPIPGDTLQASRVQQGKVPQVVTLA